MQLRKKSRNLLMGGVFAVAALGASVVGVSAAAPAFAYSLPAYTSGWCNGPYRINYGQPAIYETDCSGYYKVNSNTYAFTEHALGVCPARGTLIHLDEKWISPPTGGNPTILAWYHAYR